MALNVKAGLVDTSSTVSNAHQVRSVDPRIIFAQAETAPLVAFLRKIGKGKNPNNWKFEWIEKDLGTPLATNQAAVAAGDNSFTVGAGEGVMFRAGDLLWVPSTGEVIKVASVSGNTITVTGGRGYGTTAAAAIAANASICLLAPAAEEGGTAMEALTINPSAPYNYTQIFKHTAKATKTEAATENYAWKNPVMVDRRSDALIMHLESIERAFLWGELKRDTSGSTPRNTTKGFRSFVTTNVTDAGGAFTKAKFDAFLESVFLKSGPMANKCLLASGDLLDAINTEVLTNSNMNIVPKTKQWGLDVRNYMSPYGSVKIVYHRLMSQVLAGYGYLVDLGLVKERALRPTRTNSNVQANDADYFMDEILTETGLQLEIESSHGIIYNP